MISDSIAKSSDIEEYLNFKFKLNTAVRIWRNIKCKIVRSGTNWQIICEVLKLWSAKSTYFKEYWYVETCDGSSSVG